MYILKCFVAPYRDILPLHAQQALCPAVTSLASIANVKTALSGYPSVVNSHLEHLKGAGPISRSTSPQRSRSARSYSFCVATSTLLHLSPSSQSFIACWT